MGAQGAMMELSSSLRLINSLPIEADWCMVSTSQIQQLRTNLTRALDHLREKPPIARPGSKVQAPNQLRSPGLAVPDPIPPSTKRMKLTPIEAEIPQTSIKVEEVYIKVEEETLNLWDQSDLDDSTLSEYQDDSTPLDPLDDSKPPESLIPLEPLSKQPHKAVPAAMPTRQTHLELASNPYLQVSPELKDLLLWLNAQPLCHRAQDPPLPPDFQVLRGRTPQYYGLYHNKNWRFQLTLLLLKLPHFRHSHSLFFASIFHQSAVYWHEKMMALMNVVKGEPLSISHAAMCSGEKDFLAQVQNPIVANQVDFGLSSSDLECLKHQEGQVDLDSQPTLPLEEAGKELPELGPGITEVEMLKSWGTLQFYAYKRSILPAMKSEGCIGLMGLVRTGEKSLKGRMIVRHWQSALSNPDVELSDLVNLICQVFGLPRLAIFKWQEMVPEGEGTKYVENGSRMQGDWLSLDGNKPTLEAALETMGNYGKHSTHVDVHELSFGYKHVMELEVVEDLPWEEIKNMALVMRKSPTGKMGIKPLLNQDCMDRFLAQARACPKIEDKRLTHPQFCRSILEVFKCLLNVESKDMVQRFPTFGREFRKVRSLWNMVRTVDISINPKLKSPQPPTKVQHSQAKQCEYCGKTFPCVSADDTTALAAHRKKCKLEKSTCNCDIVFSSPTDKRSHMLMKHSVMKYLKCGQCRYVTQDQKVLDTHVEYFHGFPGREEICNVCQKSFRCRNHLYHHQFIHESHYCTPCGQEFLGRLPFRRHMKSQHGAGFPCEFCGKVILTKIQLNKHLNLKHFQASWMA